MKHGIVIFLAAVTCRGQANPANPMLPQVTFTVTQPVVTGSIIAVHAGDNLQTKYNAASCGDKLELDAGATFTGVFVFNKQCNASNWIQLVSAHLSSIPIVTYATQGQANNQNSAPPPPATSHFAKIISGNGAGPFAYSNGTVAAKYNYFAGLEVTNTVSSGLVVGWTGSENVVSQLADHVYFDRMYVHGIAGSSSVFFNSGFSVVGSYIGIANSYVKDIYNTSADTQAILMALGPGPVAIYNNFLEGAGENIMAGGTGATPGYNCTIASSPAPTTTTATVSSCVDAAGGSVSSPAVGTYVMFYTSTGSPAYTPDDWTQITGNSSGALSFNAIHATPIAGAAKVKWGIVPSDIIITGNVIFKNPCWKPTSQGGTCWDGITRTVKNLLEAKYGSRWLINGNIMQHVWNGGQGGWVNLNSSDQNGNCPWCVSSDITLTNNIGQDLYGGITLIAAQCGGACPPPGPLARVLIQNNLLWPMTSGTLMGWSGYIGTGNPFTGLKNGVDSFQLIHNHILGPFQNVHVGGTIEQGVAQNYTNLVVKDNLTEFDQYRWFNQCITSPDGTACINSTMNAGMTYTISNNAIINTGSACTPTCGQGASDSTLRTRYGSLILNTIVDSYAAAQFVNFAGINTDYHNFGLASGSPFHGLASDGKDPGVDFTALDAAFGATGSSTSISGKVSISGNGRIP